MPTATSDGAAASTREDATADEASVLAEPAPTEPDVLTSFDAHLVVHKEVMAFVALDEPFQPTAATDELSLQESPDFTSARIEIVTTGYDFHFCGFDGVAQSVGERIYRLPVVFDDDECDLDFAVSEMGVAMTVGEHCPESWAGCGAQHAWEPTEFELPTRVGPACTGVLGFGGDFGDVWPSCRDESGP